MTYSYTIEEISDYDEPAIAFAVVEIHHHESGEVYRNDVASYPTRVEAEDCIKAIWEEYAKAYAIS